MKSNHVYVLRTEPISRSTYCIPATFISSLSGRTHAHIIYRNFFSPETEDRVFYWERFSCKINREKSVKMYYNSSSSIFYFFCTLHALHLFIMAPIFSFHYDKNSVDIFSFLNLNFQVKNNFKKSNFCFT